MMREIGATVAAHPNATTLAASALFSLPYYVAATALGLRTPVIWAILAGLVVGALLNAGMATPARDEGARPTSGDEPDPDSASTSPHQNDNA